MFDKLVDSLLQKWPLLVWCGCSSVSQWWELHRPVLNDCDWSLLFWCETRFLKTTTVCRLLSRGHTLHGAVTCWPASYSMLMDAFFLLFLDDRERPRSCSLHRWVHRNLAHSEIKLSLSWHGATCYSDVTLELSHWTLLRKLHLSNCWVARRICAHLKVAFIICNVLISPPSPLSSRNEQNVETLLMR